MDDLRSGSGGVSAWAGVVDRAQRLLLWAVIAANLLFPLGLFLAGWPTPWRIFDGEESPINWFSSVQCALLGAWALAVFLVTCLGRAARCEPARRAWPWLVVAVGFFFLSVDERFQVHERTRDEVLVPHGWFTEIPSFKEGDVVLISYAVAGAVVAYWLVQDLRNHPRGLVAFVAALGLIGVTAFQDSLELRVLRTPWVRHTQIVAEETGEIWAQALFAIALMWVLFAKLRALFQALEAPGRSG